ncbi:hypothetical protein [Companilactobacillus insicii]|uniref:hypothetical protein n=1 Tax=Companilactobacillus insicii TaxID=1732567 RepID=UPI0013DDF1A1|nr:hypothetical protein [Companilactobacillus insicii]
MDNTFEINKSLREKSNPWKNGVLKNHDFRKDIKFLESDIRNEKSVGKEKISWTCNSDI